MLPFLDDAEKEWPHPTFVGFTEGRWTSPASSRFEEWIAFESGRRRLVLEPLRLAIKWISWKFQNVRRDIPDARSQAAWFQPCGIWIEAVQATKVAENRTVGAVIHHQRESSCN